jgi:hypothetical protein
MFVLKICLQSKGVLPLVSNKMLIRKERLKFMLGCFSMICCAIFSVWMMMSAVVRQPRASWVLYVDSIDLLFIKIEYITYLSEHYVKATGMIPGGKMSFRDASMWFINIGNELNINELTQTPYDFLNSKINNVNNEDLISILALRYSYSKTRSQTDVNNFIFNFKGDEFCFFEDVVQAKERFLYIGFKLNQDLLMLKKQPSQEYTEVLVAMREGHYFKDSAGTPYDNGDMIMIRIKISEEIEDATDFEQ